MQTKRTLLISALLWLTAAAVSFAASAQMGTWKLNESKSKFSGKARNFMVVYSAAKGDMVKVDVTGVDNDGKPVSWTWVGKFDGQPHKAKGNGFADMIAYKMIDDHTNDLTLMKDGKQVATTVVKVSKDGKSRIVTTTMMDAKGKKQTEKAYYDKQ